MYQNATAQMLQNILLNLNLSIKFFKFINNPPCSPHRNRLRNVDPTLYRHRLCTACPARREWNLDVTKMTLKVISGTIACLILHVLALNGIGLLI